MTYSRWNLDFALMALVLGAGSLAYAVGAFVTSLALHSPGQRGWSGVEMIALGVYPLAWAGLLWGAAELWTHWRQRGRSRS